MFKKLSAILCLLSILASLISCSDTDVNNNDGTLSFTESADKNYTFDASESPDILTTTYIGTTMNSPELPMPEKDENGIFILSCADDFVWLSDYVNNHNDLLDSSFSARLANDVDLSNIKSWTPVGANRSCVFKGTFDGGNFTVSGLKMGSADVGAGDYAGLFGITLDGVIKNLNVRDFEIYGDNFVSGICASSGGVIQNCTADVKLYGKTNLGAICGFCSGSIEECTSLGTIEGSDNMIGGICGYLFNGSAKYCKNSSYVGGQNCVGGILGYCEKGVVENCDNSADISAVSYAGGICGRSDSDNVYAYFDELQAVKYIGEGSDESGKIIHCSNFGNVDASSMHAGGICGYSNSYIAHSQNSAEITAVSHAAGIAAESHNGAFFDISNTGSISAKEGYAAGIVAVTYSPVVLAMNIGETTSDGGRAAGIAVDVSNTDIVSCMSAGKVDGFDVASGICCLIQGRLIGCAILSLVSCDNKGGAFSLFAEAGQNVEGVGLFCLNNTAPNVVPATKDGIKYTKITENDIKNGSLAFNLSQYVSGEETPFWGYNIEEKADYPILTYDISIKVYKVTKYSRCDKSGSTSSAFSNVDEDIVPEHNFRNGICRVCGAAE